MKIGYIRISTTDQNIARQELLMEQLGVGVRAGQNGGQSNSRQQLHDVKAAVMGNEPVVVQIIHQICDL